MVLSTFLLALGFCIISIGVAKQLGKLRFLVEEIIKMIEDQEAPHTADKEEK